MCTEVMWPGREADHSHASSAKFKNAWSYTSTPQYVFTTFTERNMTQQLHNMQIVILA
jgi:hypothetical protein